jgi:hypothetical protein
MGQMSYFIIGGTNIVVGQMSFFIIGGTNDLCYYRWDKCQGGQKSYVIIGGTNVRVGQMSVGQTSVALVSVGQKSRHQTKLPPLYNIFEILKRCHERIFCKP